MLGFVERWKNLQVVTVLTKFCQLCLLNPVAKPRFYKSVKRPNNDENAVILALRACYILLSTMRTLSETI